MAGRADRTEADSYSTLPSPPLLFALRPDQPSRKWTINRDCSAESVRFVPADPCLRVISALGPQANGHVSARPTRQAVVDKEAPGEHRQQSRESDLAINTTV